MVKVIRRENIFNQQVCQLTSGMEGSARDAGDFNTSAVTFFDKRLSYVGQDCQRLPRALAQLYGSQVHCLDLSFNCLRSLDGVERFSGLEELVLDNNCLSDGIVVPCLPRLHTLSLNKNSITRLELLLTKISHSLPSLTYLSLLGNIACPNQLSDSEKDDEDYQRYRYYVLHRLPGLLFLDSTRVSPQERTEALCRGQYMKVVSPDNSNKLLLKKVDNEMGTEALDYTPLPLTNRDISDHKGVYGKCRYRYSGKHSEGNRFIRNNDL
ncbi:leucine-rich melanocyte differentiation-associated protein-like [Bacillus rossius redtenbacheri]|uniref:leucine-rich melanocyte differentiation-associated protein-like n=1 Tax=Bacillus rossius redtenbacheri TaxID=93214 RepID=UPI002FDEE5FE